MEVVTVSERQPRSDSFGIARPLPPNELRDFDPSRLSRYDLLLAAIPFVLLASWLVAQFTSVPLWAALGAGALAAVPLVADGVAVNPPA